MNTKQTKELLLDFLTWIEDKYYDNEGKIDCVNTYLANNNLALGKQKPLAKNKQNKEDCECGYVHIDLEKGVEICAFCGKEEPI